MFKKAILSAVMIAACAGANAGVVTSATGAVINSGGPGFGSITDTYNQNGLLATYVSGVTDFASYLAATPRHQIVFAGNEWFSNVNTTSASVTYDLGATSLVSALALWNEESSGIGSLNILHSLDGVNFTTLASNLAPTDHALNNYAADVFSFATVSTRFVRLDMSGCPQPDAGSAIPFAACAVGEVAFDVEVAANPVPEPASLSLIALGLAAVGLRRRRAA